MTFLDSLVFGLGVCLLILQIPAWLYPAETYRLMVYAWKNLQLEWVNAYLYVGARWMHWKMRRDGLWMPPFKFVRVENRPRSR